jgi:hypothetical protein
MLLSYYIDIEIEIFEYKNLDDFEDNLEHIQDFLLEYECPLLIGTNTIYSILGLDLTSHDTPHILILNHSYSGNKSIFHLANSGNKIF